ncbi:MAG: carboxy terminal-processing peptidase [Deltaproteobacteria bacterium]|jgi:carboxyl-terminal processing protease|nr:carboxy terminal-processing peptidase [Deltaproteobacteria bacterium]
MRIFYKGISLAVLYCCIAWSIPGQVPGLATPAVAAETFEKLSPSRKHRKINDDIIDHLLHRHYLQITLDDQLSSKVFDRFLDELDPGHSYFYADDIREFELKYRYRLDEAFKKDNLKPGFEMFNRYQQRVIERLNHVIKEVEKGFDNMKFDIDETLRIDRKDTPWPGSENEMKELWRKRLKNDVLNLKLTDKPLGEIRETLLKRYRNQLNRILQNTSDDAFEFYVNSLALSIDPHTQYFSPHRTENFNINMSLSLEGIGAVLQTEDEYTKVQRLIPGGPAERSKQLKAADLIVGVGQGIDGEILDVVGWRLDEVVNKIRGPKGTLVRLEIIPADAVDKHQTKVIKIVRDKVKLEEQAAQKKVIEIKRGLETYKIGVIDIPTFYADFKGMHAGSRDYKSTTKDVRKLIRELREEGVKGIMIDLRDNGGGSLQEANSLTGLFIGLGPTVIVRDADGSLDIIRDHDPKLVYSGPLMVLVNRMSASASEIFAGAIQDYNRGIILGGQTFGKGTVQSLLPLSKGQLKATTAKYYRISGQSTQNKGVIPDLEYPGVFSVDDIGESSLPEAMAWDRINSIPYQTYYDMADLLPRLTEKYNSKMKLNPHYLYVLERKKRIEEMGGRKEVSLSEAVRRRESEEADKWRLDLENRLRKDFNKPLLEDLDELKPDEHEMVRGRDQEEDEDYMLQKTADIFVDFIETLF